MSFVNKIFYWYNKLYKKDSYYLLNMTIYHVLIIIFSIIFGTAMFNFHTFLPLDFSEHVLSMSFLNYQIGFNIRTFFFSFLILLIDFSFLFILKSEIHNLEIKNNVHYWYSLSNKKILFVEILIFYFSIGNPYMREILYFLSFNTIQIFVIYRLFIQANIPYLKFLNPLFEILKPVLRFVFFSGSYIAVVVLIITPIIEFIKLYLSIR